MRIASCLTFALLAFTLTATTAAAYEGGVIIPQADPHLEDGYIDVYYHECDIIGSQPCEHHDVTTVYIPCVDPSVSQQPNAVVVQNCDQSYPVPVCVDPVAEPDLTGPNYGGTYGNCSTTVPVQTPCIDPDAGVRESWTWYGQVTEAYVRNCTTEVEAPVCNNIVTFWSLDEFRTHNPTTCRETSCTTYGVNPASDNRFTVYAGDCDDPTEVTTHCANTDGTDVGPEGDGVRATVVVCGNTLVDRTVTPPPVTAPCGTAGSGGGNTVYVRVYPTCDWSDPANPRPTSAPIEREFQVGP